MKRNKNAKEIKTIMGAIIEIIVSLIVIIAVGTVFLFDYSEHYNGGNARLMSRLTAYALILGLAFISLLYGVVMIPVIVKRRKVAKAMKIDAINETTAEVISPSTPKKEEAPKE